MFLTTYHQVFSVLRTPVILSSNIALFFGPGCGFVWLTGARPSTSLYCLMTSSRLLNATFTNIHLALRLGDGTDFDLHTLRRTYYKKTVKMFRPMLLHLQKAPNLQYVFPRELRHLPCHLNATGRKSHSRHHWTPHTEELAYNRFCE